MKKKRVLVKFSNNIIDANQQMIRSDFEEIISEYSDFNIISERILEKGERGGILSSSEFWIVIAGTGAIQGLYTLVKDMRDRYFNCSVTLEFPNGNSIEISGLSRKEAEKKIREHLKDEEE